MSASAEVYIEIDAENRASWPLIEAEVDDALANLGYNTMSAEFYKVDRRRAGLIVEAKGWSVSYDVFEEDWAEKLVRKIHAIDKDTNVELYVYNLDREADVLVSTRYLGLDKEPQGCESCGNVDHKCVCDGGIGPNLVMEVVK